MHVTKLGLYQLTYFSLKYISCIVFPRFELGYGTKENVSSL